MGDLLGPQVRGGHVRGRGREQRQGGALLRQDGGEEEGLQDDQRTGGRRHVVGTGRTSNKRTRNGGTFHCTERVKASTYFSIISCSSSIPIENEMLCTGYMHISIVGCVVQK